MIEQFMQDTGLVDVWVESGAFSQGVAENIMKVNNVIRAHKTTLEALLNHIFHTS